MKKLFLIYLFIVLSQQIFSQITYEDGYFINNDGIRTEGLIKNVDWRSNPSSFLFRPSDEIQPVEMTIDSVDEFGIKGKSKYIRKKVKIDRSSELFSEISAVREPVFNEEVLFLKVLVEGKHILYEYTEGNLERFFIESDETPIEQLVYKSYLIEKEYIGKNNDFRKQLWLHLRCDIISLDLIENTIYEGKSLSSIFEKFNQCDHAAFNIYGKKSGHDFFNLTFKPGFNFSTIEIGNPVYYVKSRSTGFKPGYQVGIEAEYILPFNKNKWSVFAEPRFLSLETDEGSKWSDIHITYRSVELPVGLRYYFFPGKNSEIFISGSVLINRAFNSGIDYHLQYHLDISTNLNASFSLGYKFKNKYSIEVTAGTRRDLLADQLSWFAYYNCFSFNLGYSIF